MRVGDVMTSDVLWIGPEDPLKGAAVLMARHGVSGLPVVSDGRLVGIVTESDFVARLAVDDRSLVSLLFRRPEAEVGGNVEEAMTPDPFTIGPDEPVEMAARQMTSHGVKRLPVVDRDGNLVGIVSRADLMGLFARSDEEIADDVCRGGVAGLVGDDSADSVSVTVADGVVSLRGRVGTVTEKRLLEEFARHVAGVVGVESELEAGFDDRRLPPL